MPKVLLVWEQGGNLGHLARLLPIAQGLRARDVEVEFRLPAQAQANRLVEQAGFPWQATPIVVLPPGETPAINHAEVLLRCGFGWPARRLHAVLLQWQAIFRDGRASAAVIDASPLALYAARSMGLNAIALGHGFEIPPASPGPCFAPWLPDAAQRARQCEEELAQSLYRVADLVGQGLPPRTVGALYDPGQSALCTWPELDHFERPADHAIPYIGPIWADLPGAQRHAFSAGAGPKVLAYLNLVDDRHDLLWQALRHHGANVLIISPAGNPGAAQAARARGMDVAEHAVLLTQLLAQAHAVIGSGGIGLCSMALLAGKPLLLLPEHVEQGILANRLAKQGLAAATVRWQDRANMFGRIQALLAGAGAGPAVRELAARRANYVPADAVNPMVFNLVPDALQ